MDKVNNKNKVSLEDLYKFNFISAIEASENKIAYIINRCSKDENKYFTSLYTLDKNSLEEKNIWRNTVKKIISFTDDEIVFVIKKEDKGIEIVKILDEKNEPKILFSTEKKIEDVSYTKNSDILITQRENLIEDNNTDDYKVFEEMPFWSNGTGIVDKTRLSLSIQKKNNETKKTITNKNANLISYRLNKSENKIAFIQNEYQDITFNKNSISIYDIKSQETNVIKEQGDTYIYSDLCFFDDENLFYTANDLSFPGKNPEAFIININTGEEKHLDYQDAPFGGTPVTDIAYGLKNPSLSSDGKYIYFTRSIVNQVHAFRMDINGKLEKLTSGEQIALSLVVNNNKMYTIALKDTKLHEIYEIDLDKERKKENEVKITNINQDYNENTDIVRPEKFVYTNRDGIEMEVFVMIPHNIPDVEKVPVVLQIHGGPKAVYGDIFYHEFQTMASLGWASVYSNPRGSDGRGSDFANITEKICYVDYDDIIEAFDEALKKYPILDGNRAAISGGSYGGLMTNWAIGHTHRFKAACSQRSIANYLSKTFNTDIGYYHNIKQIGYTPWENIGSFEMHSPIAYEKNCTTPTVFIHSDEDQRCWQSEGIAMYNALKMSGCDARICMFYGENHGLSRTGKPHNRIRRLREIIEWFKKYL